MGTDAVMGRSSDTADRGGVWTGPVRSRALVSRTDGHATVHEDKAEVAGLILKVREGHDLEGEPNSLYVLWIFGHELNIVGGRAAFLDERHGVALCLQESGERGRDAFLNIDSNIVFVPSAQNVPEAQLNVHALVRFHSQRVLRIGNRRQIPRVHELLDFETELTNPDLRKEHVTHHRHIAELHSREAVVLALDGDQAPLSGGVVGGGDGDDVAEDDAVVGQGHGGAARVEVDGAHQVSSSSVHVTARVGQYRCPWKVSGKGDRETHAVVQAGDVMVSRRLRCGHHIDSS